MLVNFWKMLNSVTYACDLKLCAAIGTFSYLYLPIMTSDNLLNNTQSKSSPVLIGCISCLKDAVTLR